MTQDNFLYQLDDQVSIYFEDKLEKLPKPDQQNKEHKYRCTTLAEKNRKNTVAWQIDSREKLFIEMDRNSDGVLKIILDMCIIYTKHLNGVNNVDK